MLDLRGGNAQGGGAFALILGDPRAGDIVAVARALFDRIALGVIRLPAESNSIPVSTLG